MNFESHCDQADRSNAPHYRASLLVLGLAVVVVFCPAHLLAQRNSKNSQDQLSLGDIIKYQDVHGEGYGIVMEMKQGGNVMNLEIVDDRGKFKKKLVIHTPQFQWEIVDRVKKGEANDGGANETDTDMPQDWLRLRERRDELVKIIGRHEQLAKSYPGLVIGDIVRYDDFIEGTRYGIVTDLDPFLQVEVVEEGEITVDRSFSQLSEWSFFDREFVDHLMPHRNWNSANGKFSIKARLMEVNDDQLVLEKEDGSTVNVSLSKLSEIDNNYVNRVKVKLKPIGDKSISEERAQYGEGLQMLLARRAELLKREIANEVVAKAAGKMKTISLKTGSIDETDADRQWKIV